MGKLYDVDLWEPEWVPDDDAIDTMWTLMEGEFDLRGVSCSKEEFQESIKGFAQAARFYKQKIGFHRSYTIFFRHSSVTSLPFLRMCLFIRVS